jgi:hypothetical protein
MGWRQLLRKCSRMHLPMHSSMSDLPKKIQATVQDLRRLQQEIQSPVPGTHLGELDSAALKEFKAVIDYMRQLIWTYLQAESHKKGKSMDMDEEVRSLRLQHVTEMLHAIQQEAKVRQLTENPATVSFLNAVQEIADEAFKRHATSDSESDTKRAS